MPSKIITVDTDYEANDGSYGEVVAEFDYEPNTTFRGGPRGSFDREGSVRPDIDVKFFVENVDVFGKLSDAEKARLMKKAERAAEEWVEEQDWEEEWMA